MLKAVWVFGKLVFRKEFFLNVWVFWERFLVGDVSRGISGGVGGEF